MKIGAKQTVNCPHCGKPADGIAEDFIVQGVHAIADHAYPNDCGWCDNIFTVTKLSDAEYDIQKTNDKLGDVR